VAELRDHLAAAEAEVERLRTIAKGAWRFWARVTGGHPVPEAIRTVHFTMPRKQFMEFDAIFRKAEAEVLRVTLRTSVTSDETGGEQDDG
jgi:hypothetical protein